VKPSFWALKKYCPGGRRGRSKLPSLEVVVARENPFSFSVIVTKAPGTTAPEGSTMVPVKLP
jgi:hypothetical protein